MTTDQSLDVVEGELVRTEHVGFAMTPAELKNQLDQLIQVQKDVLTLDEDYGTIPGTKKPTLYKPGAEKVSYLYGLAPKTEVLDKIEDWDRPFFRYVVRVLLIKKRTGEVVGDGVGECNSFEKRYLRKSCDHWPRKGQGWPKEHSNKCYVRYTSEDADYTIANTVLKMARKRALVDAVLGCTMASHLFTQDVEDNAPTSSAASGDAPTPANDGQTEPTTAEPPEDSLPARKMRQIFALGRQLGKDDDTVKKECYAHSSVESMKDISIKQMNEIIAGYQAELEGRGEQQSA